MTYQFNFNASQVQLIVEALRTKSNEFQMFSDGLLDSAQKQLAVAQAQAEAAKAVDVEVAEDEEEQTEVEKE